MQTIKHGIVMLFTTLEHIDFWDKQLVKVMFGYCYEIQINSKISPFMILIE